MSLNDHLQNNVEYKKNNRPQITYPDLPITDKLDEVKKAISNHQVVIIAGETGSGKSTQLPKICLDLGLGINGLIGHTQPRRLAARSVASRIAQEINSELGQHVGYKIRFSDQTSDTTYIKLMTDGILLAELQADRYLKRYDVIIIDEAHERSLNIDFTLGYLKHLLPKRPDLKVIITSATIDHQRFSDYFNQAPIIEVSGRTYPVEIRYHQEWKEDEQSDLSQSERVLQAIEELSESGNGDILVFFATEREIHEANEFLNKANLKHTDILPLYARLSNQEQQRIFKSYHKRRIILSTNVAETSVTVPGIRYVIDTGKVRISRYNYRTKVQRLPIESISQASANQRAGRCGRVASGICIRLYSEDDYLSRPLFTDPEILRTNLASVILQMNSLKLGSIEKFPFIEPPNSRFIKDGFNLLYELNAIDKNNRLTKVGQLMAKLPIEPRFARMLLEAKSKGALDEILIIVSFLSTQDPRERPREFQEASYQKHIVDRDTKSDYLSIINLWNRIQLNIQSLSNNQFKHYCRSEFLSYLKIRQWSDVYSQLVGIVKNFKWQINQTKANSDLVHQSVLSGLLSHIGFNYDQKEYLGARGIKFYIFPGSFVFKSTPKWIVTSSLIETTRLYGHTVAKINADWLEKLASHLVKYHYSEPHWREKAQDVIALERVSLYGLDIVLKRAVSFGRVNITESREIFINEALVLGGLKTEQAFFRHNLSLLDDVEELEHKARRRDILVDEQVLYEFYDELIPADVYNKVTFETWLKSVNAKDKKKLYFQLDDLTCVDTSNINEQLYPNHFKVNGLKLPLTYHFDPTNKADGVTLTVPLSLIDRISIEQTDWLVPGMLEDKVIGLMRALPKSVRRSILPIEHFAKAICNSIIYNTSLSLRDLLVKEITRIAGIKFDRSVWDDIKLDDYLMMNYKIIDSKNKTLREGRNLRSLQNHLKEKQAQLNQLTNNKQSKHKKDQIYKEWVFNKLDKIQSIKHSNVNIDVYPCLVNQKEGVSIGFDNTLNKAKLQHFNGVKRLLNIQYQYLYKTFKNTIKNKQQLSLYFTKVYKKANWVDDLFQASIITACQLSQEVAWDIRSYDAFETFVNRGKGMLIESAEQIVKMLSKIMPLYHDISNKLNLINSQQYRDNIEDIKAQIDAMIYEGFISQTEPKWFNRIDIYLSSIQMRIEKLTRNLTQDLEYIKNVNKLYDQLDAQIEYKNIADGDPRVIEIEWLIQELWISYYAQKYKTIEPISVKRLIKKIQQIV